MALIILGLIPGLLMHGAIAGFVAGMKFQQYLERRRMI
jgi:hypothetical protein